MAGGSGINDEPSWMGGPFKLFLAWIGSRQLILHRPLNWPLFNRQILSRAKSYNHPICNNLEMHPIYSDLLSRKQRILRHSERMKGTAAALCLLNVPSME